MCMHVDEYGYVPASECVSVCMGVCERLGVQICAFMYVGQYCVYLRKERRHGA